MEDERGYADGRKNGTRAHLADEWQHEFNGARARRQAFVLRPCGPDLLIPRHVRIEHVFQFAGSPQGRGRSLISCIEFVRSVSSTLLSTKTSAVVRDG